MVSDDKVEEVIFPRKLMTPEESRTWTRERLMELPGMDVDSFMKKIDESSQRSKDRQRQRYKNPINLARRRNTTLTIRVDGKPHHIRVAKRPRPDCCEICGKMSKILDWHHWDDKDFSKGIWSCRKCHKLEEYIDGFNDQEYLKTYKEKYLKLKNYYDNLY